MQRVLFLIQTFMLIYTMRYWLARRGLTATAGTTFIRAILTLISIIEFMFWSWCLFEVLFVLKCLKRPIRWCCWRLMNGLNNTSMLKHKHNTTKQQIEVTWCLEVVAVWEDADDRTQHYFDAWWKAPKWHNQQQQSKDVSLKRVLVYCFERLPIECNVLLCCRSLRSDGYFSLPLLPHINRGFRHRLIARFRI